MSKLTLNEILGAVDLNGKEAWDDLSEEQHLANRGNKSLQKSLKELKLLYNLSRNKDE